jgi:hypothetical protein
MAKAHYTVVQHDDKETFEARVESCLKSGWKLVGGVTFVRMSLGKDMPERLYYCQAMTHGGKHA